MNVKESFSFERLPLRFSDRPNTGVLLEDLKNRVKVCLGHLLHSPSQNPFHEHMAPSDSPELASLVLEVPNGCGSVFESGHPLYCNRWFTPCQVTKRRYLFSLYGFYPLTVTTFNIGFRSSAGLRSSPGAVPGPIGPAGSGSVQALAASGAVAAGRAVHMRSGGKVAQSTGSRTEPFAGVQVQTAADTESKPVQFAGPYAGVNLGAGVACAVGASSSGVLVRATDPTCVSAPNWVGYCDTLGNVFLAPRRDSEMNVLDWGLDPSGVAACDDAFAVLLEQTTSGDVVYFPRGSYKFLETINMPRPQMGIEIRGQGGQSTHAIFPPLNQTILSFANAEGDGIRACTDPTTNSHGFLTIRDLVLDQSNVANRYWDSGQTDEWLAGGAAIGMIGGQRLNVQGCAITGAWRFGIAIDGGEICTAIDCDFNNTKPGGEVEGEQSFGIWIADGNRGMSVSGSTNVHRFRNCNGNGPSFLWLLDACAAVTIADGMTNIQAHIISGYAMVRGASYISVKNGYCEGDNDAGGAAFYFAGGQSINFRIEGGFYTGVGLAFAHLGPSPFSDVPGQAAGLEIHGVNLAGDWIVGSSFINNNHMSIGNILTGDIANIRNGQMYDVEPGHSTGLIANTSQSNGMQMGTVGNPQAQHHWGLKQYTTPLHLDSTDIYRFREFWVDSHSQFRTMHSPKSTLSGLFGHSDVCHAYEFTDVSVSKDAAPLAVRDRNFGVAMATVSMILGGEVVGAVYRVRQRFRRLTGGHIALIGSPIVDWSDTDGGFTAPSFSVNTSDNTISVHLTARADGQIYHIIKHEILAVHP